MTDRLKLLNILRGEPINATTIGELYNPAMTVEDDWEAETYLKKLVDRHLSKHPEHSREYAEMVQKNNVGYYAGYHDHETITRVHKFFKTTHPILGNIA